MAALSLTAFVLLGIDKRAAVRGRWRVSEKTLHLLELLGGWPGSLLGSAIFSHKSRKMRYRVVRSLCIVAHVAAVAALAWGLMGTER